MLRHTSVFLKQRAATFHSKAFLHIYLQRDAVQPCFVRVAISLSQYLT